jgi:hypothetical protein
MNYCSKFSRPPRWLLFMIGGLFLMSGCAGYTELEPAPAASTVPGNEDRAVETIEGVRVTATVDTWTGLEDIKQEVTPLQVTIRNDNPEPVRVQYSDLALVSPTGKRYAALPPYQIEGTIQEPVISSSYAPITTPGFGYRGYSVARPYGPVYPTLEPGFGPYYYDPFYYNRYYRYWATIDLPTQEMLLRALPEGMIRDGGYVSGFVYFERVPESEPRVTVQMDLVGARSGNRFGRITIPFRVK